MADKGEGGGCCWQKIKATGGGCALSSRATGRVIQRKKKKGTSLVSGVSVLDAVEKGDRIEVHRALICFFAPGYGEDLVSPVQRSGAYACVTGSGWAEPRRVGGATACGRSHGVWAEPRRPVVLVILFGLPNLNFF